jgi:hypothetical protein
MPKMAVAENALLLQERAKNGSGGKCFASTRAREE